MTAQIEVCSLRTAAQSDGRYWSWAIENSEFDLAANCLRNRPSVSLFETGNFDEVYLFGKSRWNVITPGGLYVENISYIQAEHMHRLEKWRVPGGYYNIRDKTPTSDMRNLSGKKFLLGGDNAYWHWIINWLPRLSYFDGPDCVGSVGDYKFVVVDGLPKSLMEFLYALDILDEQLIRLPYNSNYLLSDVVVPRFFDNLCISSYAVSWLRRKLVRKARQPSQRIYISRNDSSVGRPRRRVKNEEELLPLLDQHGFQCHLLARYTAEEQINLFASASMVVAPHGAGLANMAFAPPHTPVIVFENEHGSNFFERALTAMGHMVHVIPCRDVVDLDLESTLNASGPPFETRNRDMLVDLQSFRWAIESMTDRLSYPADN
jgi:hypothetical protein